VKTSDTVLLSAAAVFFALLTVGALLARHVATSGSVGGGQRSVQTVDSASASDPGLGAFDADSLRPVIPQQEPSP
jgi:hypothetical protein